MSTRIINEDLDPSKQPNYFDGQQLNVDDLEQLQIFLNTKIEKGIENIAFNGIVNGLIVSADPILAEPFSYPVVPQSGTNPDLQNYRDFPEDILDTQDVRWYQVFQAVTNNVQRLDLKLEMVEGAGASVLLVELVELTVPSNPLSALSLNVLHSKQFTSSELPSINSNQRLVLDYSSLNDNQGIPVAVGSYYAVNFRFIRETNSQDKIRVFHSNTTETAAVSSDLGAHFYVNGAFQQGIYSQNAELIQLIVYHKVYTSAVQVSSGQAYFKGEHINVSESQRHLSLLDRRNNVDGSEYANFVAIQFVLNPTDPELHPRTGNTVDSRYQDTFEVRVFTKAEWDVEVAKSVDQQVWLLLATVTDRNVVPFSESFDFQIDQMTNLAYNDWLNPCICSPSLSALQIKASRPDDFVFFVDNVPAEMPLLDDVGHQIYDEVGRVVIDRVSRVYLILYLDGGQNTRRFEMALNGSTPTTPPFNSYFITITDPEGSLIPGIANFAFDKTEMIPNTFYNFVAETERGRSIFIQDYNVQIRTPNPSTGIMSLTRERQFEINLTAGSLTAIINEDLKLGDPIVPYGNVGQRVTGFDAIPQYDEAPGRNGTTASRDIYPVSDTLLPQSQFKFEPLPMCFEETGDIVLDTDISVQDAIVQDDIVIKITGTSNWPIGFANIPISYSGTQSATRGGTGAPHTVSGRILFSSNSIQRLQQMQDLATSLGRDPSDPGWPITADDYNKFIGLRVTSRNHTGKDCSQQSITAVTHMDDSNLNLVYRVIAMGRGVGSDAGFVTGETGNVYIENRLVRDVVGVPLEFTYTPFGASIMDIRQIDTLLSGQTVVEEGTGEQWFGEREIIYTTSSVGLADNEVGIHPSIGQVFWNTHDENLLFNRLNATASIHYFQLNEVYSIINFYYTRLIPWSTAESCPIINNDPSVQDAITQGWIIIKVNGSTTYPDPRDPLHATINLADPLLYVSMPPGSQQELLQADKISLNPELGRIVFGADIKPSPEDEVTVTYYQLRPVTTCALTVTGIAYDVRFDFNADGRIDEIDLNQFQAAYGSSTGDPNYSSIYDFNSDGSVDQWDYEEFLGHFGAVSSGLPSFREATQSRLNSILVFRKSDNFQRFQVVRAICERPSITYPLGRTVLFFNETTPIRQTDTYVVMSGFAIALVTGVNSVMITTTQPITANTNKEIIQIYNLSDPTDQKTVIDVVTLSRLQGTATVYDNTITFTPSVVTSSTYIVRTVWQESGVAIVNRSDVIETVFYELRQRKNFGPFKMSYTSSDFASDGTSLTVRFASSEATMADGTPDSSGLHLKGVPIENMRFAVLLFVPVNNNLVDVWRWHHLVPTITDRGIVLQFNDFLSVDSRYRGKNGVPVLQPFGVGQYQVDLRPKFAGGDIENDLVNIIVIRDDYIPNVPPTHNHTSETQGGVVTSANIAFEDSEARFQTGNVTEVVYQLQDSLQLQLNELNARLRDLQLDAAQVIVSNARGCFDAPSGHLTLADTINQILDKIGWDTMTNCP